MYNMGVSSAVVVPTGTLAFFVRTATDVAVPIPNSTKCLDKMFFRSLLLLLFFADEEEDVGSLNDDDDDNRLFAIMVPS